MTNAALSLPLSALLRAPLRFRALLRAPLRFRALLRAPLRFRAMPALVIGAALLFASWSPVMAEDVSQSRSISVSATGTATAVPDIAMISTGVVSEGNTAREALDANTTAMVAVIEALREAGIEGRDIQTTDFSVQPRYSNRRDNNEAPVIEGYRVVNSVRIRVRRIKDLGDVLDAVVSEGSNQIDNIAFDISNADELRDRAREDAVDQATRKARLYAGAAGASLGRVMQISEQGGSFNPRPAMMRSAMAAESVPIEAGESTISITVNMSWELR